MLSSNYNELITLTDKMKKIKLSEVKEIIFYKSLEYYNVYIKEIEGSEQIFEKLISITKIKFTERKNIGHKIRDLIKISDDISAIINNYLQDICYKCKKKSISVARLGNINVSICKMCLISKILKNK
tara:strand:- start:102 stop:482 length:381 start_codon:yes stop_codon:yes gene_type:complete